MLADFCVRLALGMTACLLLLSPAATARPGPGQKPLAHPNFFRTQCLTVLALAVGSLLWLWASAELPLLACLAAAGLASGLAAGLAAGFALASAFGAAAASGFFAARDFLPRLAVAC